MIENYQIIIETEDNVGLARRLIITTDCCRGTSSDKFLLVNLSQLELDRVPLLRTNQEKELIKKNLCVE